MAQNAGDLSRTVTHDPDETWPVSLEIVAYFGEKRRKRRSVEVNADQFFGRNGFGAPMSAESLLMIINRLRIAPSPEA
jgi:hypothetical protein